MDLDMPTLDFLSPQQMARALSGDVKSGNTILAPGPNHSAANRSLSVKLDANAPDGFVVHSFAGDDPIQCRDYVRSKCGLGEFKPNGGKRQRATSAEIEAMVRATVAAQREDKPRKSPAATFDYVDETGALLYQVLKYKNPKRFLQRRPDGSGNWKWKLDDVPRVIYRWPELLQYPDGTVFVTEGEKDADRVASLGHCATTVASGRWTDDCIKALAGHDCIILEDADKAGREKALAAAQKLHGTAASIRIVRLPGLTGHPNNKDVSDWLDADARNAGKLADVCLDAPIWTPGTAEAATATGNSNHGTTGNDGDRDTADKATSKPDSDKPVISATPFIWRDPATIPPRAWLYGRHYIRQFLSCTIAPGGWAKSSQLIVEALAMASGRALLGVKPPSRLRVWYWNGEDPIDEVDRRIEAAMVHFDIKPEDVEGYLFRDSGRKMPIIIATQTRNATVIAVPVAMAVAATIKQNHIDVMVIDPFVKSHRVTENDNLAIDMAAEQWAAIADLTNCAIEASHHTRKVSGGDVTVEDSRGASALMSAARVGRVLNRMNQEEASQAGVVEQRWRYFRNDKAGEGKANMSAPPEHADWFKLVSVDLGNGDNVGVVTAWQWPSPFEGITVQHLQAAQKAVSEGGPWRAHHLADDWVGKPIAKALNLNLQKAADRVKVRALLATWIENGMFVEVVGEGRARHKTTFVEVGKWASN
jgi:AAA domain